MSADAAKTPYHSSAGTEGTGFYVRLQHRRRAAHPQVSGPGIEEGDMNSQFRFFTDTATLAIFDPERLKHRADAESDWWCLDFLQLEEFRSGSVALVALGGDGAYRVRITDRDLTPDERDYATGAVRGLGVEAVSGKLFAGPAECIPGGGSVFAPTDVNRGLLIDTENGRYDVDLFAITWFNSPRWWSADGSGPDGAPADIVAVLKSRVMPFMKSAHNCVSISIRLLISLNQRQGGLGQRQV